MVTKRIYVEGGGSKEGRIRCREGFRKLLTRAGFSRRIPRLVACGGRESAFKKFKIDHAGASGEDFVALLIDSEEPVSDVEATWQHASKRDGWDRPPGAEDSQVLFMTTCMETWIMADPRTLEKHFGQHLQKSALLPGPGLEQRNRREILKALERATRNCPAPYKKGPKSFEVLGKLAPDMLQEYLPSFRRAIRILESQD